jgi:hypothetical protein
MWHLSLIDGSFLGCNSAQTSELSAFEHVRLVSVQRQLSDVVAIDQEPHQHCAFIEIVQYRNFRGYEAFTPQNRT